MIGTFLVITGILIILFAKIPFFSRLPGNILIQKENFTFYFPLSSCILISIILTILLNLIFFILRSKP
ncbi:MAG: DUF2905 domain-containing protein [candidate division WOR-3 bacterium]